MRSVISAVILFSILTFSSCLSRKNDVFPCSGSERVDSVEMYYIDFGTEAYVSINLDTLNFLPFCDPFTPNPDSAFNDIYLVTGIITISCETGTCFIADEFQRPYCEVDYIGTATRYDLFQRWRLAYFETESQRYHPSCNENELSMSFNEREDGSVFGTYFFGLNDANEILTVTDNFLIREEFGRTFGEPQAYTKFYEDAMIQFMGANDTLAYEIIGNQLTISSDSITALLFIEE